MSDGSVIISPDQDITITKWVIHEKSQISAGIVLCLYTTAGDAKIQRLMNKNCGLVKKLLFKEGDTVKRG